MESGTSLLRPTTPATLQEFLYKILIIGDFGVGKTAIIRRYTEGYFTPNYKLTIGVDFAVKTIECSTNTRVTMQLWDIAGHERFGQMTRVYYKYAIAAVIVFDLSRPATFDSVMKWLNDVNQKVMLANGDPIPVLLLANKCDLDGVVIDEGTMGQFCKDNKFIGWFATSAKEDLGINEAMESLVSHILKLEVENEKPNIQSLNVSTATRNGNSAKSTGVGAQKTPQPGRRPTDSTCCL